MSVAAAAPEWWVPAHLLNADPRTPFGRLLGMLAVQYDVLTGTNYPAQLTALDIMRVALAAEERYARSHLAKATP